MPKKSADKAEMPIDNAANNGNNQEEFIQNEDKLFAEGKPNMQTATGSKDTNDGKKEYVVSGDMTISHSGTIYRQGDHIFLSDDECSEQLKLFLSEV